MAEQELNGIAASPGVAIGQLIVLPKHQAHLNFRELSVGWEVEWEVERLNRALSATRLDLAAARREMDLELEKYVSIIDAYIMLLDDRIIKHHTRKLIESQKISAEWALSLSLSQAEERFKNVKDEYIRGRFRDVVAVIDHVMRHLSGDPNPDLVIREKGILVANDLSPAVITRLDTSMIIGLATDLGGPTSHTAIIARALGIPAVLGMEKVSSIARSGEMAIIDGSSGTLLLGPTAQEVSFFEDRQLAYDLYIQEILALADLPSQTLDGVQVEVGANIELLEEIASVHNFGAHNVGLYRTEFACLSFNRQPTEDELFDNLRQLVQGLNGLEVTIRTLDIGGDKLVGFSRAYEEQNPNLGLRGIRYSLKEKPFFMCQLRAILRASHYGPVKIMFPMVASVEEFIMARQCLEEAKEQLRESGIAFADYVPTGIMIEVPAAVSIADILAKEVDFFSIGTNDLIQYTMAIDRNNDQVAALYQPLSTAVLRLVHSVALAAKNQGIPVTMCGEMAGNPEFTGLILGLGVHCLSMSPLVMPRIKEVVRKVNLKHWQEVANQAMGLPTVAQISELVTKNLKEQMPDLFDEE